MNWTRLDRLRRKAGPVQLDLIESYAQNKINRRDFVRRGTIIGMSVPAMGAVLAACGSDGDSDSASTTAASDTSATTAAAAAAAGGSIKAGIQFGDANSGLDPLNMLDLGTYAVLTQSFEYLVGLGDDGNIAATGLAASWEPNADATAWTFTLRDGVTWQDGSPFTSADVAASIDRQIAAGVIPTAISEGSTETPDDLTVVVNLDSPNGNLPVLVSLFNPQTLVTPADYSNGTTLDARATGTGAWIFESHDPTSFVTTFRANEDYWGGRPILDTIELLGFESGGNRVAAMQSGEIDIIQQFGVIDGFGLLSDDGFNVLSPPSSNHRQIWFNTQLPAGGPFTDARVRRAIGYCIDRQEMVDTLFEGRASIGNDHPVVSSLPFFDADATPQRGRDIEMARSLLAEAGAEGLSATLETGDIEISADMAAILERNCAEAGISLSVNVTANSDFYGEYWCAGAEWGAQPDTGGPGVPCGASAPIGIVDYGHRPVPDIFFGRALVTDGDWNSSNYASAEFDQLVADYQSSVDVEGQKTAIGGIQQVLHEDAPALYPFFFDYLGGHSDEVSGVQMTALGHIKLEKASKA